LKDCESFGSRGPQFDGFSKLAIETSTKAGELVGIQFQGAAVVSIQLASVLQDCVHATPLDIEKHRRDALDDHRIMARLRDPIRLRRLEMRESTSETIENRARKLHGLLIYIEWLRVE
jgi:hypothetical protein